MDTWKRYYSLKRLFRGSGAVGRLISTARRRDLDVNLDGSVDGGGAYSVWRNTSTPCYPTIPPPLEDYSFHTIIVFLDHVQNM